MQRLWSSAEFFSSRLICLHLLSLSEELFFTFLLFGLGRLLGRRAVLSHPISLKVSGSKTTYLKTLLKYICILICFYIAS